MPKEYQVYKLWCQGKARNNNISGLNDLLKQGWVPVRETPAGPTEGWNIMAWCVVLEREVPDKPKEEPKPKKEPTLIESLQQVIDRLKKESEEQGADIELVECDFLDELKKM